MIFVNLIYRHFDILRFQYGQIKKVALFQVCAIVVLQLHTARKEDPITPQTHLGASKYPPDISREVKMSTDNIMPQTDTSRHTQTAPVSVQGCLAVSVGICCRLMASWVPWRCLGGVWRMSGGCLGVSGWKSWKSEALRFVGVYLGSQSLQYGA